MKRAGYCPRYFYFVSVHKHTKIELGQYPVILTGQGWRRTHITCFYIFGLLFMFLPVMVVRYSFFKANISIRTHIAYFYIFGLLFAFLQSYHRCTRFFLLQTSMFLWRTPYCEELLDNAVTTSPFIPGGRGCTPWNFCWGCAALVSKSRPNFRPKNAIS